MVRVFAAASFAALYAGLVHSLPVPGNSDSYGYGNDMGSGNNNGYGNTWTQTSPAPSYQTTPPSYGYGNNNEGKMSSSTMMNDMSSTMMEDMSSTMKHDWMSSSSMMDDMSSTLAVDDTSTVNYMTSSTMMSEMPMSTMYGSGSNSWDSGNSGYDNCVQQCQAQYGGAPPSMSGGSYGGSSGSPPPPGSGSGTTHTVIVAPSQGVLRYVPFATNASVGDTVKFMWGANNHTVTKSSELTPCNKTADGAFASGIQIKDFVFEQVINDTNPLFFYCGVPGHCDKGMFGIINPPSATGSTSLGAMMPLMASNSTGMQNMMTYAANLTANNAVADTWGQNIDLSKVPDWSRQLVAEGVLYTQTFLATNPDAIKSDGTIDVSMGGNPAVVPKDISVFAASNNAASPSTPASTAYGVTPSNTEPASSSPSGGLTPQGSLGSNTSAAVPISRSSAMVAVVAVVCGFFLF